MTTRSFRSFAFPAAATRFLLLRLAALLIGFLAAAGRSSADLPVVQEAYLKASNTFQDHRFGTSVTVWGNTVVVGAPRENSDSKGVNSTPNTNGYFTGAAYVYVGSGADWTQQAYLKANIGGNLGDFDYFGWAVAMSGETLVVGAYGDQRNPAGANAYDIGAAYVFVRDGTTWTQQAVLKANPGQYDKFGWSVAVSGDTIVVGAPGEDSDATGVNGPANNFADGAGAAYVFVRQDGVWTQQAYLKAGNTGAGDTFGWSVGVDGDTIVVGANGEASSSTGVDSIPNDSAPNRGAAYVFARSGTVWAQQAYLKAGSTGTADFGISVGVSGNTVVVGADGDSGWVGAAYVFTANEGVWTQQAKLTALTHGVNDYLGGSVAVSGDRVIVGAKYEGRSSDTSDWSGAAYLFTRSGTAWTQQAFLKAGNPGGDDYFGSAVAVSGDNIAAGAWSEDSSTKGINSPFNDLAANAGAAYHFHILPPPTPLEAWRKLHFNSAANSGNAADAFDADGDGIPNLAEFAFGLNPVSGASAQLPAVQRSGSELTVSFAQPPGVSGITYGMQWSATLLPESWTAMPDTGSGQTHLFQLPMGTAVRKFVRFTVTAP